MPYPGEQTRPFGRCYGPAVDRGGAGGPGMRAPHWVPAGGGGSGTGQPLAPGGGGMLLAAFGGLTGLGLALLLHALGASPWIAVLVYLAAAPLTAALAGILWLRWRRWRIPMGAGARHPAAHVAGPR